MTNSATARAGAPHDVADLARRLSGYVVDLHAVALDDQTGRLHIPLVPAAGGPAGKLLVGRVADLTVERGRKVRWFGLDGLAYDPALRRLTVVSVNGLRLAVGVEALELTLRLPPERAGRRS